MCLYLGCASFKILQKPVKGINSVNRSGFLLITPSPLFSFQNLLVTQNAAGINSFDTRTHRQEMHVVSRHDKNEQLFYSHEATAAPLQMD